MGAPYYNHVGGMGPPGAPYAQQGYNAGGGNAIGANGNTPGGMDRTSKRRRRVEEEQQQQLAQQLAAQQQQQHNSNPHSMVGAGGAAAAAAAAAGAGGQAGGQGVSPRAMRDMLSSEVVRMDAIKALIADPSTTEHAVAQRGYTRLRAVTAELEIGQEAQAGVLDMARQVADILLMLRFDDEPSATANDFHDYTLVAVVAVAAHLMKAGLGDDYGLNRLAERYGHEAHVLDQVFWQVLTRLSFYRELHVRSQQLGEEPGAALDGKPPADSTSQQQQQALALAGVPGNHHAAGGAAAAAGAAAPQQVVVSEVDSFAARLNSILSTDMSQVVYSAVSQETIPLGPLATLMPLLQMAGVLNDTQIKSALKVVRECQEQLVVLDRSHSIKVQHIQKEYQDFMERVRAKAQAAIDKANHDFQTTKGALTTRMNQMVDYLQQQIPLQQLQHAAQQIQRAAAVQVAAAVNTQQGVAGVTGGGLAAALASAAAAAAQQQGSGGADATGGAEGAGVAPRSLALDAALLAATQGGAGGVAAAVHELAAAAAANQAQAGAGGPAASQPSGGFAAASLGSPTPSGQQQQQQQQARAAAQHAQQQQAAVAPTPVTASVQTMNDLCRAVIYGQVALEAIPEPIRGQIALMLHAGRNPAAEHFSLVAAAAQAAQAAQQLQQQQMGSGLGAQQQLPQQVQAVPMQAGVTLLTGNAAAAAARPATITTSLLTPANPGPTLATTSAPLHQPQTQLHLNSRPATLPPLPPHPHLHPAAAAPLPPPPG